MNTDKVLSVEVCCNHESGKKMGLAVKLENSEDDQIAWMEDLFRSCIDHVFGDNTCYSDYSVRITHRYRDNDD